MEVENKDWKFNPDCFKINLGTHRGKNVIWLEFPYNMALVASLKSQTTAHWSQSRKAWYLADNRFNRNLCRIEQNIVGKDVLTRISPVNLVEFQAFQKILTMKGYAPNTIRTYSIEFAQLLYVLKETLVKNLDPDRLQSYFYYCSYHLRLSESVIHSRMNAVKFYFEQVLHREKMFFDIPRPKKPLALPKSLNIDEVKRLFSVVENSKHRLILKLCYGLGLRVSEIVNLKISNIDSHRMKVLIQRGKGKKDRYVNLPESVLEELRAYYKEYLPKLYLFEGQYGGAYSARSAQLVFKKAMDKAGIRKKIGIHGLRHSYATHLLELGTDVSLIQKLLGHNNIKTTLIYAQVADKSLSRVKSPLDMI